MTKLRWLCLVVLSMLIAQSGLCVMSSFEHGEWRFNYFELDHPQTALLFAFYVVTICWIAWRVVLTRKIGSLPRFMGGWFLASVIVWFAFVAGHRLAYGGEHLKLMYVTVPVLAGQVAVGPPWFYEQSMIVMQAWVALMALVLGMLLRPTNRPASHEPVQRAKVELKLIRESTPAATATDAATTVADGQAKGATA